MAIDVKKLDNWTILVAKDWEWIPMKLSKIFYDISTILHIEELEKLIKSWTWIIINKTNTSLNINIDYDLLAKHFLLERDDSGMIFQDRKVVMNTRKELAVNNNNVKIKQLEDRITQLENIINDLKNENK